MNPVSGVSWVWRAWRGRSVTFAALFATSLLGVSVLGVLRQGLSRIGVPWWGWLIAPFFVVSFLAKKEAVWIPDEAVRRKWARWLVLGSIAIALVIAWFAPKPPPVETGLKPSEPMGRAGVRHP